MRPRFRNSEAEVSEYSAEVFWSPRRGVNASSSVAAVMLDYVMLFHIALYFILSYYSVHYATIMRNLYYLTIVYIMFHITVHYILSYNYAKTIREDRTAIDTRRAFDGRRPRGSEPVIYIYIYIYIYIDR